MAVLAAITLLITMLGKFSAAASCLPASSGFLTFWPGDGNANDLFRTNNGTLAGGTTFASGQVGSAFSFDGVNDTVQIGGAAIPVPWTAEFWVNRQASPQDSAVLLGDSATALKLEQYPNTKKVGYTIWGVEDYSFNYIAPTGTWVHLVFVCTTTSLRLYVNGALQDTLATIMTLPRGQMGNDINGRFNKPLKGLLDEVSLYNRALSANEIASIYTAGAEGKCKAPEITAQPQSQTVSPGNSANFSITATGLNPLRYQWRKNGQPIAGATASTYVTPALQVSDHGNGYSVVVTNTAGSITSSVGIVSLCTATFPDNFGCRREISGSHISLSVTNVGATRETNEPPHHPSNDSESSLWFTWTAPASGGVVVVATDDDFSLQSPIVAVYSGTNLTNLVQLAANSTDFSVARAVFTAVAGRSYQIVFDSVGQFSQGTATLTLDVYPPPTNDLFASAATIPGNYFGLAGSFIGANREIGEPSHGATNLGQTLWWNWTAPTNGPNPLSVRLIADGVNFPPGAGVYTGNTLASLSALTLSNKTNGMTTDAIFNAVPGTTYRIALAGSQNDPDSTALVLGNFRFRLNVRALALSITNFSSTTNGDDSVNFQANARIQNLGAATSGPLRVSVSSLSGLSTTRPIPSAPLSTITNLSITNLPSPLAPGQSTLVHFSGVAPAPELDGGFDQSKIFAYGVFAALQEQPIPNRWFTVDETLVTFDKWPAIGDVVGPGGGVIRLDPDYVGLSEFNPLASVAVIGPPAVIEGRSTNYTGKATYADTTVQGFTNTAWSAAPFTITTNGVFTAGGVTSNTPVTLNATYAYGGLVFTATTNVIVLDLPPPAITNLRLLGNAGLVFTLSGVPGRSHVIEATANLTPPAVWLPLATNAPASGVFNFTNFSRTNFPLRFFRAREF